MAIGKRIDDLINAFNARFPPVPFSTKSPISLTDFGTEIAHDVGADAVANELFDKMGEGIKEHTPYQTQEMCFEFVRDKLLKEKQELKTTVENCSL